MTHVDMLKALAMLLVVMGHIFYFCTYNETGFDDELIFNVICTFHVPLFWFLSGFVVYEAPSMRKSMRKSWSFLRPMLVVGLANALLIGKVSDFFLSGGHNGYWYLLALAIFYLVMPVFRVTSNLLINKKGYTFLADVLLAMAVWMVFKVLVHLPEPILSVFTIYSCHIFWPFFIIGFLVRKYELHRLLTQRHSLAKGLLLAAAYVLTLTACYDRLQTLEGLTSVVVEGLIALLAIAALFALFYQLRDNRTAVSRQLLFVGRHTLHIYIFHYFFIRFISTPFLQGPQMNVFLKLAIVTAIAVAVVYASILLGWLYDRTIQLLKTACRNLSA